MTEVIILGTVIPFLLIIALFIVVRVHNKRKAAKGKELSTVNGEGVDYDKMLEEAQQYDYDRNKTSLEFKDAKSDKFWSINHNADDEYEESYFVHYGRNGTMGRMEVKVAECLGNDKMTFYAEEMANKKIAEKLGKGYVKLPPPSQDKFQEHKNQMRETLDSMYMMMDGPQDDGFIVLLAIKSLGDKFCDLLRINAGNESKIISVVKGFVLALNSINDDYGVIETMERESLCEFILAGVALAGLETDDDITEEWREW